MKTGRKTRSYAGSTVCGMYLGVPYHDTCHQQWWWAWWDIYLPSRPLCYLHAIEIPFRQLFYRQVFYPLPLRGTDPNQRETRLHVVEHEHTKTATHTHTHAEKKRCRQNDEKRYNHCIYTTVTKYRQNYIQKNIDPVGM